MSLALMFPLDTSKDLVLEREVPLAVSQIWQAWTTPELLQEWFCPLPWRTVACTLDLRPGGCFRTVMRSPEGVDHPNEGAFLEIVPNTRLVFTSALQTGFRPAPPTTQGVDFPFSALIEMAPLGPHRSIYRATAIHGDAQSAEQHKAMGFHEGWGMALDQLVALMQSHGIGHLRSP